MDHKDLCANRGWYSRNYLPHLDVPGLVQSLTFRLVDALPRSAMDRLQQEAMDDADKQRRIEAYLDAGHGACWLRRPALARITENALLHFDGDRYQLIAWCVMPNHVHALIRTREPSPRERRHPAGPDSRVYSLAAIVHSWKSFTAKAINRALSRHGPVWQREYFERYIRDDRHLAATIEYIHDNPVKAGLARCAAGWAFSSARFGESRRDAGAPWHSFVR